MKKLANPRIDRMSVVRYFGYAANVAFFGYALIGHYHNWMLAVFLCWACLAGFGLIKLMFTETVLATGPAESGPKEYHQDNLISKRSSS